MILRDYQTDIVNRARESFASDHNSACIQLPTGGGKTAIESDIISRLAKNGKIVWHIYPRNEIGHQVEDHFKKWNITFGQVKVGHTESRAFSVHLISKDTLVRRWDKIKRPPDYVIIDEAHLNYDFQIEFKTRFPECKIIGFTATPERLSGESLRGIYDTLIEGVSIPELTSRGFLASLRYFSPPISGLDEVKRRGTEYDENELDLLLKKRKVYGEAIEHYRKYADKKPALVFTRSVKSAYDVAEKFSNAGYKFYALEGKSGSKERKTILDALKNGQIDGITSCELFVYGLDIPRVEVGICLRPTLSRALYMQMIGRILRPSDGKSSAMFFDHVGNLFEHQDPRFPGMPLHYIDHIEWNFEGRKKRERNKSDERLTTLKLCPNCYMYFEGSICPTCGTSAARQRQELKQVESELKELNPVPLAERPPEEKKEYTDRIESAITRCGITIDPGAVGDMLKISRELGYTPMWAYHKLNGENRISVNVSLLSEIARQQNYKPGWVWMQKEKLKRCR